MIKYEYVILNNQLDEFLESSSVSHLIPPSIPSPVNALEA